jgi:uncharacterized circularly permuted ATP-grasp superfamily protein
MKVLEKLKEYQELKRKLQEEKNFNSVADWMFTSSKHMILDKEIENDILPRLIAALEWVEQEAKDSENEIEEPEFYFRQDFARELKTKLEGEK